MKDKACCFTGHRKISNEKINDVKCALELKIIELTEQGVFSFLNGGALGFDMLSALTIIRMKTKYPQLILIMALPCKSQTHGWSEDNIKLYEYILSKADEVIYTSEEYSPGCIHKRNRYLVDHASYCIAYLLHEKGGTAYTVNYALKNGLNVSFIK